MANTLLSRKPQQIAHETCGLQFITTAHNKVSFASLTLSWNFQIIKNDRISRKLTSFFGITDNRDVLKEIISGRKMSSTKIPYRGKGLPNIYKGLERNYYSNLKIISNDVKADLTENNYEKISKEFNGTFLYWELNNTNRWTS